jgi:hypothetical protein
MVITAIIGGVTASIIGMSQAAPIAKQYWYVAQWEFQLAMDRSALATERQSLGQLEQFLRDAEKEPVAKRSENSKAYIKGLEQKITDTKKRIERGEGSSK